MAKTDPIMAPLHLVVANSEVMMEERGSVSMSVMMGSIRRTQPTIASDSHAHKHSPEYNNADDGHSV